MVQTCLPDLGPFLHSSTACDNQADMLGVAMAVDAQDEDNMDTVEFTIRPCETGGQVYDGTGGTGGTAGSGGTMNGDDQGGCDCAIHNAKLNYTKVGFSVALIGVLVVRRLRRRRR